MVIGPPLVGEDAGEDALLEEVRLDAVRRGVELAPQLRPFRCHLGQSLIAPTKATPCLRVSRQRGSLYRLVSAMNWPLGKAQMPGEGGLVGTAGSGRSPRTISAASARFTDAAADRASRAAAIALCRPAAADRRPGRLAASQACKVGEHCGMSPM